MVNKELDKVQRKQQPQLRVGAQPAAAAAAATTNSTDNGRKAPITLNEAKKKGREQSSRNSSAKSSDDDTIVKDIYQNVSCSTMAMVAIFDWRTINEVLLMAGFGMFTSCRR